MVRFIADPTGRFARRSYYEDDELENECDAIIGAYYRSRGLDVPFPIPTDDLNKIIEAEGVMLDLYADLGPEVDGCTVFRAHEEPEVLIAVSLSEDDRQENRLRTTLTHELAHVKFHGPLFRTKSMQLSLFADTEDMTASCHRDNIVESTEYDWLEWQAGFASTAMLMPRSKVIQVVCDWRQSRGANFAISFGTPAGEDALRVIQKTFKVSNQAARIRLKRLGLVVEPALRFGAR